MRLPSFQERCLSDYKLKKTCNFHIFLGGVILIAGGGTGGSNTSFRKR